MRVGLQITRLAALSQPRTCDLRNVRPLRVCERIKLKVNVGKSRAMRCSRYGNGGRIHLILNGEPLEEVDCFKYLGSQVAAGGGCERYVVHRMNEGYRVWGALKAVLTNRGLH